MTAARHGVKAPIQATIEWAEARLRSLAQGEAKRAPPRRATAKKAPAAKRKARDAALPPPLEGIGALDARFVLGEDEQAALALCFAVEGSLEAARLARALSGARGLTVEVLRAALDKDVTSLLSVAGVLRSRGLLVCGGVPGGLPSARDEVWLGPGVAARLAGDGCGPEELAAGIARIEPPPERPAIAEPLQALLRDHLADARPRWATVGWAGSTDARALAETLAFRMRRPAVLFDARVAGELPVVDRWALVAALRREVDLLEVPLVVESAGSLGVAWRALAAPPPPGGRIPPCIVLLDEWGVAGGRPGESFAFAERRLAEPARTAPNVAAPAPPEASPVSDAIERARRQAALDAARALGRPVIGLPPPQGFTVTPARAAERAAEAPRAQTPSTPAPARTAVSDVQPPSATTGAHAHGTASAETPSTTVGAPTATSPAQATPSATPPAEEGPSEENRRSIESYVGPTRPARERRREAAAKAAASQKASQAEAPAAYAAPTSTSTAPSPAEAVAVSGGPDAQTAAAGGAPQASLPTTAVADPSESLPFVDVPSAASAGDLLQVLPRVANPLQRADLLRRLSREPRDPSTVAMMRAHLRVEHPLVRAAAEEGMAQMFGPNWNKAPAIPKPVQPPRSDDGGNLPFPPR